MNASLSESPATAPLRVEALLDPSQFDHETGAIRLLETHISWVILTGAFAYKLKKPVNLGFLDFSTLALRKHYCDEELRLNRRLAPEIYLEVVPITGTPAAPRLGGDGPVVDYAVKMREFPQDALLDRVVCEEGLPKRQVDALAERIAAFHDAAERAPDGAAFARAEDVAISVNENLDQLEPLLGPADLSKLHALREWNRATYRNRRELVLRRRRDGFVRECHGDLHLGNIALVDGKPLIFDCIEFSKNLHWIDVMSDVAFITMDFDHHGRQDIAWRFINRYLQHTGDYGGLALLRYYQAYRAAVRAKVAALRATQGSIDADEHAQVKNEYCSLLQQACDYTREQCPSLTITRGLSGCGKTTITGELVEVLGAIRLRSDVERKRLHGLSAQAHSGSGLEAGLYTHGATDETYERLRSLAGTVLNAGYSVIVDATFLDRRHRDAFRGLAESRGVAFKILDIGADAPHPARARCAA